MKFRTKPMLVCCALALATGAMAMDAEARTSKQEYDDAVYAARTDYYNSVGTCKTMSGGERRDCYREAKDARVQAIMEARAERNGTAPTVEVGRTPADRKEMRSSNPQTRKTDDPTP